MSARDQAMESLIGALKLILPMAKGYAAEHNVGSNQMYVAAAEKALDDVIGQADEPTCLDDPDGYSRADEEWFFDMDGKP